MRIAALAALVALLLSIPVDGRQPLFKKGRLVLTQARSRVVLTVEVADTPDARSQGLMHRASLADNAGMLFIFEDEQRLAFWMKNTLIPLSIAFFSGRWRVVDVQDMAVAPSPVHGPFNIYQSTDPAKFALEVKQGLLRKKGIGVGARGFFTLNE